MLIEVLPEVRSADVLHGQVRQSFVKARIENAGDGRVVQFGKDAAFGHQTILDNLPGLNRVAAELDDQLPGQIGMDRAVNAGLAAFIQRADDLVFADALRR